MVSKSLATGIFLGTISVVTLVVSFLKFPNFLKKILLNVKWLTDLGAGAIVYILLGQTVTAIIASAWATLWIGVLLNFAGNKK